MRFYSVNSITRFSATVSDYAKYRPGYPNDLFSYLIPLYKSSSLPILELGSGTGLFTQQFAKLLLNNTIIAIEPNNKMRLASPILPNVNYCKGEAENTGLSTKSVSGVCVAQAFHWFDIPKTLIEIQRVCTTNAPCCALWNDRTLVINNDFNIALEQLLIQSSTSYPNMKRPSTTINELQLHRPNGKLNYFNYSQELSFKQLLGRINSLSYVAHGVDDKKKLEIVLEQIFMRYQTLGLIKFQYKTVLFSWIENYKQI
jgi:ubiquinone/menaquinone biosynthesis C-methylase UbiE